MSRRPASRFGATTSSGVSGRASSKNKVRRWGRSRERSERRCARARGLPLPAASTGRGNGVPTLGQYRRWRLPRGRSSAAQSGMVPSAHGVSEARTRVAVAQPGVADWDGHRTQSTTLPRRGVRPGAPGFSWSPLRRRTPGVVSGEPAARCPHLGSSAFVRVHGEVGAALREPAPVAVRVDPPVLAEIRSIGSGHSGQIDTLPCSGYSA